MEALEGGIRMTVAERALDFFFFINLPDFFSL